MHVITRKRLAEFWAIHPSARAPLAAWHKVLEQATFTDFASVRNTYRSADQVKGHVVFDVHSFRVVTNVRYQWGKVFILEVLTHTEYDKWTKRIRKG